MINIENYLLISLILFILGIVMVIARKNILAMMLGAELILNASALNFVAYTRFSVSSVDGQIMSLFIIIIAAAEATVGLAIAIRFFKIKGSMHVDDATELLN